MQLDFLICSDAICNLNFHRYDCPALKLAAWRVVQETTPGFASMPSRMLNNVMTSLVSPGSGITGMHDI